MAVLEILQYPDERLKQVSAPVLQFDDRLARIVADLEDTMASAPGCVGLAAPQVNHFQRVVIVDVSGKAGVEHHGHMVLVNPEILEKEGDVIGREGCLSVPDYTGNVARPHAITVRAQDVSGNPITFRAAGYEARAILHEIDHLDGALFLDRIVSRRDLFRRKVYQKKPAT